MKSYSLFYICVFGLLLNSCDHQKPATMKEETSIPIKSIPATLFYQIEADLGEGAFWNHKTDEFLWIDILKKQLYILEADGKTMNSFEMPSMLGTVVPYKGDEVLVALQDGVYLFNVKTKALSEFAKPDLTGKNVRFNDGKCDPSGRLWVGTMDLELNNPIGSLYMFNEDRTIIEQEDNITISNGIVWNKAKDKMFYIDTPTQKVVSYDYDNESGAITNKQIITSINDEIGGPDGMAIDENDNLWVCLWNGNGILNIDTKTGKVIQRVDVPAHNVTSCAFGGVNLETLYITTAKIDMNDSESEQFPNAGSLFIAKPGVKGVKSHHFGN